MGVCSSVASSTSFIPSREPVARLSSVGSALCPRSPSRLFRSCISSSVPVSLFAFVPLLVLHSSICRFTKPRIGFFAIWSSGVFITSQDLVSVCSPSPGVRHLGLPTSSFPLAPAPAIPKPVVPTALHLGGGGAFGLRLALSRRHFFQGLSVSWVPSSSRDSSISLLPDWTQFKCLDLRDPPRPPRAPPFSRTRKHKFPYRAPSEPPSGPKRAPDKPLAPDFTATIPQHPSFPEWGSDPGPRIFGP